jgi:hypothetical protein
MQGVQADLPRFPWASGELTAPGIGIDGVLCTLQGLGGRVR